MPALHCKEKGRVWTATMSDYWSSHLCGQRRQHVVRLTKWILMHGQFFLQFNSCGKKLVCCVNKHRRSWLPPHTHIYVMYAHRNTYLQENVNTVYKETIWKKLNFQDKTVTLFFLLFFFLISEDRNIKCKSPDLGVLWVRLFVLHSYRE